MLKSSRILVKQMILVVSRFSVNAFRERNLPRSHEMAGLPRTAFSLAKDLTPKDRVIDMAGISCIQRKSDWYKCL